MKKKLRAVLMACMIMVMAAGCSNTQDNTVNEGTSKETRVVTDAKGEVTIPANPKRIVDLSGSSDILSLLGFNVVGTCNSDAYDYTKFPSYLEETLSGAQILGYSMSESVDLEAVIALNPDLIVISNYQESSYEQLSEIAPTIMIQLAQMDWKEDFMSVATVMDKETEAKEWLAAYEAEAKALGEEIKAVNGEDATYLSFLASGGSIFIFDGAALGSLLYEDLGLARPENLPKQENVSLPVVTYEGLAEIDADYIAAVTTDEDLKALEESGIFSSMKAISEGNYITLPSSPYFNQGYSPVGRQVLLQEIRTALDAVKAEAN